jgi:hypothetical protein
MGRVRETTVAVEKHKVLHISLYVCVRVCVYGWPGTCMWVRAYTFAYPVCNAYAPYLCHLWPLWLCHIFPRYLINGTISRKTLLNIKCVFWFSLQLLSKTFLIPQAQTWKRLHVKYLLFLSGFSETCIFSTDFRKTAISNFIKIRPSIFMSA